LKKESFLFPSRKRFKTWSYPSKASFVGMWIAIVGLLAVFPVKCNRESEGEAIEVSPNNDDSDSLDISLFSLYEDDFTDLKLSGSRIVHMSDGYTHEINCSLIFDFDANTMYLAFYISESDRTYEICEFVILSHIELLESLYDSVEIESGSPGERPVNIGELIYSERVFIYHESNLFHSEINQLTEIGEQVNVFPQFRGSEYLFHRSG